MTNALILTKLTPLPPRAGTLPRPGLVERLRTGATRRFTLISAPAGFGKTTLLYTWLAQIESSPRVAWLALDPDDNDPARFLAYLNYALHHALRSVSKSFTQTNVAPPGTSIEQIVVTLINQLQQDAEPLVLVLDDYHWIEHQSIHAGVEILLEHAPPDFHLVLSTREDPPLPLGRLRAAGELTEIRLQDLRFTPAETTQLLSRTTGLPPDDIAVLNARIEGWPAGLAMAVLALRAPSDGRNATTRRADFIRTFAGSNRYVADYLVEEVLLRQPPDVQAFLLQTSILERLNIPLCAAVTREQDAGEILQQVERANLFLLPLDATRTWYRYHRLFADLLQARLQNRYPPSTIAAFHRRAAAWYAENGDMDSAIEHTLAAQDVDTALDLIASHAQTLVMRGETATLLRWLADVPEDAVLQQPDICLYQAWALLIHGYPLHTVRSRLTRAARPSPHSSGRTEPLRAMMALLQGDIGRAEQLAVAALADLPADEILLRSYAQLVQGLCHLADGDTDVGLQLLTDLMRSGQQGGNMLMVVQVLCSLAEFAAKRGQLRQAESLYGQALDMSARGDAAAASPLAAEALIGLGEVARIRGNWKEAARALTEGVELAQRHGRIAEFDGLLALAQLHAHRQELKAAEDLLLTASRMAQAFDATELDDLIVALALANVHIAQGRLAEAAAWAESRQLLHNPTATGFETPGDFIPYHLRKYEQIVVARLRFAQGELDDALLRLDALLPVTQATARPLLEIEVQALRAMVLAARKEERAAREALTVAVNLAAPEGIVAPFMSERGPLTSLLSEVPITAENRNFVHLLSSRLQPPVTLLPTTASTIPAAPLVEPLTPRELDVLRLLEQNLTAPEIAGRLTIGESTVRTHIKHIYGKLGVNRRLEAVDRARLLGLT